MSTTEGTRFSVWTDTNHQTAVWIVTALSLVYSLILFIVRLAAKYRSVGLDDAILGTAYLTALAEWIITFLSLEAGAGAVPAPGDDISSASDRLYTSRILMVVTIGLTKCTIVAFLRQLFTHNNKVIWRLCTAVLLTLATWTVASTLLVSVDIPPACVLADPTRPDCRHERGAQRVRWKIVVALDICFEVLLIAIPAYVINTLQMSMSRKLTVIGAFAFRLGVVGLWIAFLESYLDFQRRGSQSIDMIDATVLQQILLGYALISATIPCLRNFLGRFQTGDLARLSESETHYGNHYGSRTGNRGGGFALSTLDREGKSRKREMREPALMLNPGDASTSARAYTEPASDENAPSIRSFRSDQMIIRKTVDVNIMQG